MDICGEHGDDIAHAGRDCPACIQIEDIEKNHKQELEEMQWAHNEEIDSIMEEK